MLLDGPRLPRMRVGRRTSCNGRARGLWRAGSPRHRPCRPVCARHAGPHSRTSARATCATGGSAACAGATTLTGASYALTTSQCRPPAERRRASRPSECWNWLCPASSTAWPTKPRSKLARHLPPIVMHGRCGDKFRDGHGYQYSVSWGMGNDACIFNRPAGVGRLRDGSWAEGSRDGNNSIAVRVVRKWVQERNANKVG